MNIAAFKVFGANPIPMRLPKSIPGWKPALSTLRNTRQRRLVSKIFRSAEVPFSDPSAYSPLLVVINKAKFDGLTPGSSRH